MMRPLSLALALALLTALAPATAAEPPPRPNVIVILADDLGWADLGCYGSTYHRTPHLDRLARDGLRFTDAYAACPVCSPTRAALLTGRYPARLHLTDWLPGRPDRPDQRLLRPAIAQHLPPEVPTVAELLHAAGYATGHVGKWHLGGAGFGPRDRGFDVNVAGDQRGSPPGYFAPFRDPQGRFLPGLEDAEPGAYLTDALTGAAQKFVERNKDRPFFLYLAHYAVHIPLQARAAVTARYPAGGQPGTQNNPVYAAMVESVDESVGRLRAKLAELGLAERTVLLFTSDNGGLSVREGPNTPATSNAPLREGKGYLYEGGIREPLLVYWPGVTRAGSVSSTPVCSIDFLPTILDVCRVSADVKTDGIDLVPLLQGGAAPAREALYWHYPHYSNQGGRPGGAVRAGDWKLLEFYEQGRQELYDLKADVGEVRNRIADKPEVAKELLGKLRAWRESVGAQGMRPNPDYHANPQAADGTIALPARTAEVHGTQLRYEPSPHKDTLGYWTRAEDWASWDFEVSRPGTFAVTVLQGCGPGQGGSEVELAVADQTLRLTVEDTGHFQNFKRRDVGRVRLGRAGRYTLRVTPRRKPAGAVMDLRSVTLRPVAE
jgi:arylsulfatase A-like enzyme